MKVVAIVGMTGSGKSEVAAVFSQRGFAVVRFGDITDGEVSRWGLPLTEANERTVREALRREHGMDVYARLSLPKIEASLKKSNVVVDGLYSWEEYLFLKERFGGKFAVMAVWASPRTRYARLAAREVRPLTAEQAAARDHAEIENLNKGGPIAMADYTIINESSLEEMKSQAERIIYEMK
jgi:dephospho-CoA kinase